MNKKEKEMFSRQITLPEVGEKGQEELEDTGILIVGMGGLGCPVAQYLISSGIGYLTIMDPDKVELSNLSRQPLYNEENVGSLKVNAAKNVLSNINPNAVITYTATPSAHNVHEPRTVPKQNIVDIILAAIVTGSPLTGARVPEATLNPSQINIALATTNKALPILPD